MTKEIQRKLTSLTLMTIMFAGGLTFAAPSVMPSAYAASTPNLFVSAENSQFSNTFLGVQVIEVVVSDPNLDDTDGTKGAPDVTVNGAQLSLAQADTGSWYGYFANYDAVTAADVPNSGLEFGETCPEAVINTINTEATDCKSSTITTTVNVIRHPPTLSNSDARGVGQIGLDNTDNWPFIQLYEFSDVVRVSYQKSPAQTIELSFNDDEDPTFTTDRTKYPLDAHVHLSVNDHMLNIDPTDEDSWTFNTEDGSFYYYRFNENGKSISTITSDDLSKFSNLDLNDPLLITSDSNVLRFESNDDSTATVDFGNYPYITLIESEINNGIFVSYDTNDDSSIRTTITAPRTSSAIINYDDTDLNIIIDPSSASVSIDVDTAVWSSGQSAGVTLVDKDANKNSRSSEDLTVSSSSASAIPTLQIGNPFTLGSGDSTIMINDQTEVAVQPYSERAWWDNKNDISEDDPIKIVVNMALTDVLDLIPPTPSNLDKYDVYSGFRGFNLVNVDVSSIFGSNSIDSIKLGDVTIASNTDSKSLTMIDISTADRVTLKAPDPTIITLTGSHDELKAGTVYPIVFDLFSFGITGDGVAAHDRTANQIIRIEVEETDDNTATFTGSLEYTMINQLNILKSTTYTGLSTIADDPDFIVFEDYTDEDSPRVNYNDLDGDGVLTVTSDQQKTPSHTGAVSFNSESYKVADTVTITLIDPDLNVDSSLIEIYRPVTTPNDTAENTIGSKGLPVLNNQPLGKLLEVTFNDQIWALYPGCAADIAFNDGLAQSGFTLAENATDSGVFKGTFQVPDQYCQERNGINATYFSVTGTDIDVNYIDYRDAAGEIIEVGDSAGIRANTGTITLDRPVYPVPFGATDNFVDKDNLVHSQPSYFQVHDTGFSGTPNTDLGETLPSSPLQVHIRVNDPDYDISASGSDNIATNAATPGSVTHGPVKITVSRGSNSVVLGYAGGLSATDGKIGTTLDDVPRLGPIAEVSPDSGIFELDLEIQYSDGPRSNQCPTSFQYNLDKTKRFQTDDKDYCILQGDILNVEYSDQTDASGQLNTVTDSATFDLRNGVLQTDKSIYIIGSDMLLILIEPDLNLDSDATETIDLDLIEWDSPAAAITMGNLGGNANAFDPEPSDLRETGDNTGIFQVVINIPRALTGTELERGETIDLEYIDFSPSGADYVGDESEDITTSVATSNYGATIELDQRVYSWTDKVYITITAPDHNFDSNLIDEIGDGVDGDPLRISTRGNNLPNYKLVETGTNTGVFSGEVILTGFEYDADGDRTTGNNGIDTNPTTEGVGPTSGTLEASDDDGITVSYEYTDGNTVIGTALVRWNVADVTWLEPSYSAAGSGLIRVIDPDMNLNPEAIDNFKIDIWSDRDSAGVDVTVTETNEATGVFEGTVFFTATDDSSGHRIRIAEGDTVTARYSDNTLPEPNGAGDNLDVYATTQIGAITEPLERVGVSNLGTVDALGNSLSSISVDQQIQIQASLLNNQDDRSQPFAYLVQIQDADGVTVALSWLNGELDQKSLNTAQSWIPKSSGLYTVQVFVWEGINNPTALAPSSEISITVS